MSTGKQAGSKQGSKQEASGKKAGNKQEESRKQVESKLKVSRPEEGREYQYGRGKAHQKTGSC